MNQIKFSNQGYIVLTSVIIISVILIAITTALSYVNYFSRFNVLKTEYKEKSTALAEACVAYAKTRLSSNLNYNPNNEVVLLSSNASDTCTVASITNAPPNKIIKTQSQYQKAFTNYSVTINANTFAAVSFIENPN